ncbi:hypothetical protein ACIBEJ_39205 [Nonomuraea sp. NPDC050790]|uniref:hypothetical protein n=1 Tax=Nonomuraea sp. NPDC050790 TaxID=3364371 RepID=UPI003789703F
MRYAWLCHPATVVAALLLLVNDHLLKQAWPGFVTGKLSDVAGLVVAAPLLSLLLLRRADLAATLLTGALFILVKTTETGAEAASVAWTLVAGPSRVLADPSDLLALPALVLAWWIRNHEAPRRWTAVAGVPLAVLAVAATSATHSPPAADVVRVDGARITVTGTWAASNVSTDGGRTWHLSGRRDPDLASQRSMCVPREPRRCYWVRGDGVRVMQSDDASVTWRPSWELSPGRHELLERAYGEEVSSASLAVQATARGHVVVVANGRDGVAVRDEDGQWTRLGYDPSGRLTARAATPVDGGDEVGGELAVAVLAGLWACVAGLMVAAAGRRRSAAHWIAPALATAGVLPYVLLDPWPGGVPALLWLAGAPLLLAGVVVAIVEAVLAKIHSTALWTALGTGVLVALGIAVPFRGWAFGWPDSYEVALALAAFLAVALAALGLALVRRAATTPADRP